MQWPAGTGTLLCCLILSSTAHSDEPRERPHIVVIVADDVGWDDVSFHGSKQIPTPNLDALASDGVILNSHYVQPMCTPSRSAFFTGLYPIRTGTQHFVIMHWEPRGLPLKYKIMPQYFRDLGYATHAVGKWHLGHVKKEYSPTYRGFDSFYGYHTGAGDYYDHTTQLGGHVGLDFFYNTEPIWNATGQYATDLFTDRAVSIISGHNKTQPLFLYLSHMAAHSTLSEEPFQAPQENVDKFGYIGERNRTLFAGMMDAMDASVGKVMEALSDQNMLDNTILLFYSDNGGMPWGNFSNRGSNWPLRGMKGSLWEGAVRSSSFIWSPLLKKSPRVSHQMVHVTDWLPTLVAAAGGDSRDLGQVDGLNLWQELSSDIPSPRVETLLNHDNVDNTSALRFNQYKVVKGLRWNGPQDGWFPTPGGIDASVDLDALMDRSAAARALKRFYANGRLRMDAGWREKATVHCRMPITARFSNKGPFLFNIEEDPCEKVDLSLIQPTVLRRLLERLQEYEAQTVAPGNAPPDPKSFPENLNGVWDFWQR